MSARSKSDVKIHADQLIGDWAEAAHRGVSDAITNSVLDELSKLQAISALDYVMQPLAVVTPFFAPALVAVFKAGPHAIRPEAYKKMLKTGAQFTSVDKAKILDQLSMTKSALDTIGAANDLPDFAGAGKNRKEILDKCRVYLYKLKSKMRISTDALIEKYYDSTPDTFSHDNLPARIFDYKYINRVHGTNGQKTQLDELHVHRDMQVRVGMSLFGGFSRFTSEFVDGPMQGELVDSLNKIVIREFYDAYPGSKITHCDLKSINKYGGTVRSISEKNAQIKHAKDTESGWSYTGWHTETKTFARRISKIYFKDNGGKRDHVRVEWHPNLKDRFSVFGFNYTPV